MQPTEIYDEAKKANEAGLADAEAKCKAGDLSEDDQAKVADELEVSGWIDQSISLVLIPNSFKKRGALP